MVINIELMMWILLWALGGAYIFITHLIQTELKKISHNFNTIVKYLELINSDVEKNSIQRDVMKNTDQNMNDQINH